jgi:hypothetical protein
MSAQRTRHDQNHWQQLVDKHAHSGQSGAQFCREQQVAYASFMSWRKRLGDATLQPGGESHRTFVELTAPSPIPENTHTDTALTSPVCVELALGAGIELRITRST